VAKRHPSLIPLSRDHHDGLLLALRLKQGRKALLHQWSHDPSWQANYVAEFFNDHLVPHFEAEESVLFPAMRRYVKESAKTIEKLLDQHEEIRKRVRQLQKAKKSELEPELKSIGELLDEHIRIEEHELFPMFEKSVPGELAEKLGEKIQRIDKQTTR